MVLINTVNPIHQNFDRELLEASPVGRAFAAASAPAPPAPVVLAAPPVAPQVTQQPSSAEVELAKMRCLFKEQAALQAKTMKDFSDMTAKVSFLMQGSNAAGAADDGDETYNGSPSHGGGGYPPRHVPHPDLPPGMPSGPAVPPGMSMGMPQVHGGGQHGYYYPPQMGWMGPHGAGGGQFHGNGNN